MAVAKYKIDLEWKAYSVNLSTCEVQFKALGGAHYCGNQAHSVLELWFVEEPTQEVKDDLIDYWASITDSSDEATDYFSVSDLQAAIQDAKEDAVTKTWDTMSVQQRKIISGVALSSTDNAAVLTAFPQ